MLPKFTIRRNDMGRWFVETNWLTDRDANGLLLTTLQVTTSGRLSRSSAGWSTRAKAEAAVEQCKARLR